MTIFLVSSRPKWPLEHLRRRGARELNIADAVSASRQVIEKFLSFLAAKRTSRPVTMVRSSG